MTFKSGRWHEPTGYMGRITSAFLIVRFRGAWAFAITLLVVCAAAQGQQVSTTGLGTTNARSARSTSTKSTDAAAKTSAQNQPVTAQPLTPVQEVLSLTDAGVSKEVIKTYVENARFDYTPTAQDLIALKQHAVPDDITTTLVKRGAEMKAQKQQASQMVTAPANLRSAELDPEGYDYFQRYYLFPRTLAYVYDRLGGNCGLPGCGFYSNQPFGPGYGYSGRFVPPAQAVYFQHPATVPLR